MQKNFTAVTNCSVWKLQLCNYATAYDIIRLSALMSLDSIFRSRLSHFLAYDCFLGPQRHSKFKNQEVLINLQTGKTQEVCRLSHSLQCLYQTLHAMIYL